MTWPVTGLQGLVAAAPSPHTVSGMALPVLALLLAVLAAAVAFASRRRRTPDPVAGESVAAPASSRGPLDAHAVAALLTPGTPLLDGWEERVADAVARSVPGTPPVVGPIIWNRTALRLGLPVLRVPDPTLDELSVEAFSSDLELAAIAPRRGSLRVRRRLAHLPEVAYGGESLLPEGKPWSARASYETVDWEALDLPEPIPDEFIR